MKGNVKITVPTATSNWKVTLTFDKDVKDIIVQNGKNENCNGKVCTFENKQEESLNEGDTLELVHRVGFFSEVAQVIDVDFNGEAICEIGTEVRGMKDEKPNIVKLVNSCYCLKRTYWDLC